MKNETPSPAAPTTLHDLATPSKQQALEEFRAGSYRSFIRRPDSLMQLVDSITTSPYKVTSPVTLSLNPVHERGHGSVYDALNNGEIDRIKLLETTIRSSFPCGSPMREQVVVLAADTTCWPRPNAVTVPDRSWVFVRQNTKNQPHLEPGWRASAIVAISSSPDSWVTPLDFIMTDTEYNINEVAAKQLREIITAYNTVFPNAALKFEVYLDAGYSPARIWYLLADLPIVVAARRTSKTLFSSQPQQASATGRRKRHGTMHDSMNADRWARKPDSTGTYCDPTNALGLSRYGKLEIRAWNRMHQVLKHKHCWKDHPGELPIIEGTVIRVDPERNGSTGTTKSMLLWSSDPDLDANGVWEHVIRYVRRFDIEHLFRFAKQELGLCSARLRDSKAAERWMQIQMVAYNQLRLASELVEPVLHPWETRMRRESRKRLLTPGQVRRGFWGFYGRLPKLVKPPHPNQPGKGRRPGQRNTMKAPRFKPKKKTISV